MRDSRLVIGSSFLGPGVDRRLGRSGDRLVGAEPRSPARRCGVPAGSRARARHVAAAGTVEDDEGDPGRGERGGGFGGPAVQPARRRRRLAGLAQHDQHLAAQQVPPVGQVGQEPGVASGRGLQGRVRQAGRGVEQGVDGRGEVDRLGPHQDLDRLGRAS